MSKNIYQASFGHIPVRFVLVSGVVHVSKDDLYTAISDCFTPAGKTILSAIFESGLGLLWR
jgi:hypothetical protein